VTKSLDSLVRWEDFGSGSTGSADVGSDSASSGGSVTSGTSSPELRERDGER
jgi:hypothetical protein